MRLKTVFSGLVEKNDKIYLLLDTGKGTAMSCSGFASSQRRYFDEGESRFVSLLRIKMSNYKKLKGVIAGFIREKKEKRLGKMERAAYNLAGQNIYMNLKPAINKFFDSGNLDFIKKNTTRNRNFLHAVTEGEITGVIKGKKYGLFRRLERLKQNLYNNDKAWISFFKRNRLSLAVIFPTYNEVNFERNVQVLNRLRKAGLFDELIVSDGYSTLHEPSQIKRRLSRKIDIDYTIVRQSGVGKGGGIESAVKYAFLNHDFAIIVDSDILPSLGRVYPDSPINIDIEFFVRNFISSIIDALKTKGKKGQKVFFKASYLRMPQLKKSLDLRYGLATAIVKDFLKKYLHSESNLYPLSGEVAFNCRFFLENLTMPKSFLNQMALPKSQYCGANVPDGFTLENFWNCVIEIKHFCIYYVNMYTHHHGPVVKASKRNIEEQRGEVMTGAAAGIARGMLHEKKMKKLIKKLPLGVIRSKRPVLELEFTKKDNYLDVLDYRVR